MGKLEGRCQRKMRKVKDLEPGPNGWGLSGLSRRSFNEGGSQAGPKDWGKAPDFNRTQLGFRCCLLLVKREIQLSVVAQLRFEAEMASMTYANPVEKVGGVPCGSY